MRYAAYWLLWTGLGLPLYPQATLSVAGPSTTRSGQVIPVSVLAAGTPVASTQWELSLPVGWTRMATPTSASLVAGKSLSCSADLRTCLLWGMNATLIPAGEVARYSLTIPANQKPGSVTLTLSRLLGASPEGNEVATVAGPAYVVLVKKK